MMTNAYNHEISDLREQAIAVLRPEPDQVMSARTAARCLYGVVSLMARKFGDQVMQEACGKIVRHEPAWMTSFGDLPRDMTGRVPEAIEMIAVIARGILSIAGKTNLRAALSFWATETDPAIWTSVLDG